MDMPSVVTFASNPDCGLPWQCQHDDSWDSATETECNAMNTDHFRNMENAFINNVAAGSSSMGFWLEMRDKNSNQLNGGDASAFVNNVAHSNHQGFLTYKKG